MAKEKNLASFRTAYCVLLNLYVMTDCLKMVIGELMVVCGDLKQTYLNFINPLKQCLKRAITGFYNNQSTWYGSSWGFILFSKKAFEDLKLK